MASNGLGGVASAGSLPVGLAVASSFLPASTSARISSCLTLASRSARRSSTSMEGDEGSSSAEVDDAEDVDWYGIS